MAGLGDLPAEMLMNVVSFISDRTTLRNLPLVSRAFRAVSEPHLYSHYLGCVPENNHRTLRLFMRTILNRPELALYVKRVHVQPWGPGVGDGMALSRDERKLYRDQGRSSQLARLKQFTAALSSGMEEAEIILLLSRVVNMEFLAFTAPPTHGSTLWRRFLGQTASNLNDSPRSKLPLHALRTVVVSHAEVGSGLSPLFRLPALRSFIAIACFGGSLVAGWDCPERSSLVTSIMMLDCCLSGPALSTILNSCKALEEFDYIASETMYQHDHFTSGEATKAFESQKHSLRTLLLKYAGALHSHSIWSLWGHDQLGPLALANLEKLTGLTKEYDELLDEETAFLDLLPPSLETLTLRPCGGESAKSLVSDLYNLADARNDRFPHLDWIDIEIEDLEYWSCSPLLELTGHLERKGINFRWWSDETNCGGKDLLNILNGDSSDFDEESTLRDTEAELEPDIAPGSDRNSGRNRDLERNRNLGHEPDPASNPVDES